MRSYESFVNGNQRAVVNTCWNFHHKSIVIFPLVKNILIWMSQNNFECKCSPVIFWMPALLTAMLLENISGWIFYKSLSGKNDLLSYLCWVRIEAHFLLETPLISFRYLIRLLLVLWVTFTVGNNNVSLANNLGLQWGLSDTLLMCIRNKNGPNIET